MSAKKLKVKSDHIFVTGKGGVSTAPHSKRFERRDDAALLALQLACPKRINEGESDIFAPHLEIHNIQVVVIETKHFSSLVLLGSDHPFHDVDETAKALMKQLQGIIKLSHEKIYFIESFHLPDPNQLEWGFLSKMSDYCFMQQIRDGNVFYSYFRLEKTTDEERFAPRSTQTLSTAEVADQDLYLYFEKSDRYIKILKKGDTLDQKRIDRLNSNGIQDVFVSSDQGTEIQQRRIRQILHDLLDEYSSSVTSGE